jgi:hypothetical protein
MWRLRHGRPVAAKLTADINVGRSGQPDKDVQRRAENVDFSQRFNPIRGSVLAERGSSPWRDP